jgi:heterodisulfide reductase subunit A-like polyferredoxin
MTEEKATPASGSILVVGGGISGLTTALEAAEVGYEVKWGTKFSWSKKILIWADG